LLYSNLGFNIPRLTIWEPDSEQCNRFLANIALGFGAVFIAAKTPSLFCIDLSSIGKLKFSVCRFSLGRWVLSPTASCSASNHFFRVTSPRPCR